LKDLQIEAVSRLEKIAKTMIDIWINSEKTIGAVVCPEAFGLTDFCSEESCPKCRVRALVEAGIIKK